MKDISGKFILVFPVPKIDLISAWAWKMNALNTVHHSKLFQLLIQAWPIDSIFGSKLTFVQTQMSFMNKVKCSLTLLVRIYNMYAFQDNVIFHGQLLSEGPIVLNLAWNSSDGT